MKKAFRITGVFVALLLAFALCSCGGDRNGSGADPSAAPIEVNGDYVMKYGDRVIDEHDYMYFASYIKDSIVAQQQYYLYMYYGQSFDEATVLAMPIDDAGRTVADVVKENVVTICQQMLVLETLCDEAGITITDKDTLDKIDQKIADLEYEYGGEDLFDIELAKLGISRGAIERFEKLTAYYNLYREYKYGENGVSPIAASTVRDYFKENYIRFDGVKFAYNDTSDGGSAPFAFNYDNDELDAYYRANYVKVAQVLYGALDSSGKPLSDEETEAIGKKAEAVAEQVRSGEKTLEDFKGESDDGNFTYVFTRGDMVDEFDDAAFDMEIGEVRCVKTSYGFHVMMRVELTEEDLFGEEGAETPTETYEAIVAALTKRDIAAMANGLYEGLTTGKIKDFPEKYEGFTGYLYNEPSTLDKNNSTYSAVVESVTSVEPGGYTKQDIPTDGFYIIRRLDVTDENVTDDVYSSIESDLIVNDYLDYVESFYDRIEINREVIDKFDIGALPALPEVFLQ